MRKYIYNILLIPAFCFSQQSNWIIPAVSSNGNNLMPYYDFSGINPSISLINVTNYKSTQATGNGEYCNSCSDTSLSSFFITGDRNNIYTDPISGSNNSNQLQIQYTQNGMCNQINNIFSDNTLGSGALSHESLSEIAIGNGQNPGTFLAVMLGDTSPSLGGREFYVYEFDFNNPSVNTNRIATMANEVNSVMAQLDFVSIGFSDDLTVPPLFNEGVALSPLFTYNGVPIVNSNMNTLNSGTSVRSIYISSTNGYIFHLFIDPINMQVYIDQNGVFNVSGAQTGFGVYEMDLSFPTTGINNHPRFLALAGWGNANTRYYDLNANGTITSETVHLDNNTNNNLSLTVEFDQTNTYLYYDSNGDIYRHNLITTTPFSNVNDQLVDSLNLNGSGRYMMIENAGNNRMYINRYNDRFLFELSNPSNVAPPTPLSVQTYLTVTQSNQISAVIQNTGSFGLPDWVDGENPLGSQGIPLEICLNDCPEFENNHYQANFSMNGIPYRSISISPNDPCQTIYVCPNASVTLTMSVNGNSIQPIIFNNITKPISHPIDLTNINNCYTPPPFPECCNKKLEIKEKTKRQLINAPSGYNGTEPFSTVNYTYEITQNSLIPITEFRAVVTDIDFKYDLEACAECIDNPALWGSIGGSLYIGNDYESKLTNNDNGANILNDRINRREVIWKNLEGAMLTTDDTFSIDYTLPPLSEIPCCITSVDVCIEFSYKDANCNVCTEVKCVTIDLVPPPKEVSELNIEIKKNGCCDRILKAVSDVPATYQWNTGAITKEINVESNGTYTVTATSGSASITRSIVVNDILKGAFPLLSFNSVFHPDFVPPYKNKFYIMDISPGKVTQGAPNSYNANEYKLEIWHRWNTQGGQGVPLKTITGESTSCAGFNNWDINWDGTNQSGTSLKDDASDSYVWRLTLKNCNNESSKLTYRTSWVPKCLEYRYLFPKRKWIRLGCKKWGGYWKTETFEFGDVQMTR